MRVVVEQQKKYILRFQSGLSLIELTISLAIAAVVLAGVMTIVGETLATEAAVKQRFEMTQQARFAMQRMTNSVGKTRYLMLPLTENPATAWSESVRDVLAVTLDPTLDRDNDGWADANNDKDFQDLNQNGTRDSGEWERVDEDSHSDMTNDDESGIIGIDDDGDGAVDEAEKDDDDEDGTKNEEENGPQDLDGDFAFGEDLHQQMIRDEEPGIEGVDDDGDGSIDEGDKNDDDEDGSKNEDWLDPVVYYLNGSDLVERMPAIDPVDGTDFVESVIASSVSFFQITRYAQGGSRVPLVLIELTITASDGESYSIVATVAEGELL